MAGHRLQRLISHLIPKGCDAALDDEEEAAIKAYMEDGTQLALSLGNRGPLRFDADGKVAQDIVDAYKEFGFYVFEKVVSAVELEDFRQEYQALTENAPATKGSKVDVHGRPVKHPMCYTFLKPLSDPQGGSNFGVFDFKNKTEGKPRHPVKMRVPKLPENAPERVQGNIVHPLAVLDSALRIYGHPGLLKFVEAINGEDFTPFTESLFQKHAGFGPSTAWHQDPSSAWDEDFEAGRIDGEHCGFSFHYSIYNCTPENGLWVLPGSHKGGRADIKALSAAAGGSDRLPGAVPVICGPGDVYVQNRMLLHGAFANTSEEKRVNLQFGFHRRASIFGKCTKGYAGSKLKGHNDGLVTYDEDFIYERSKMIQLAIDARKQRYPNEVPYSYLPFRGKEDQFQWSEKLKEGYYDEYWMRDLVI